MRRVCVLAVTVTLAVWLVLACGEDYYAEDTSGSDGGPLPTTDARAANNGSTSGGSDAGDDACTPKPGCNACCNVCVDGGCGRAVFVTSAVYQGDLDGIEGGDEKCTALAHAAGLSGSFRAWLSESSGQGTGAASRLEQTPGFYRVDGQLVATALFDLIDGELSAPITLDEHGNGVDAAVWTGTKPNGNHTSGNCNYWNAKSGGGTVGFTSHTDGGWTEATTVACDEYLRLYCFEN